MSTRSRRRKRDARIARDAKPFLRLTFPEGTPPPLIEAFARQIRWQLNYRIARRADGSAYAQAYYVAPAPFQDLEIADGQIITVDQLTRAIVGFAQLAREAAAHGTQA